MLLAIDTATRWMGLALRDETAVIAETGWRSVNTQTIELAPTIAALLARANAAVADLTAVAVAIGPGSYTGLRVGLAAAKGLALARQIPLIGVPTLDVVAAGFGSLDGQLIVVAEAGRTRIHAAPYAWHAGRGWQAAQPPSLTTWEALLEPIVQKTLVAGEVSAQAIRLMRDSGRPVTAARAAASVRRAGYLAEIGWVRFKRGLVDDAAALAPNYLRAPEGA